MFPLTMLTSMIPMKIWLVVIAAAVGMWYFTGSIPLVDKIPVIGPMISSSVEKKDDKKEDKEDFCAGSCSL